MSLRDLQTATVELSVGLVLTVSQSNWRIARLKDRLEREASELIKSLEEAGTPIEEDERMMRETFYPLLAAPVISGNCPSVGDCLDLIPSSDLDKWYEVVRQVNPQWFAILDKIAELAMQQEQEAADAALKKGMMNSGLTSEEQIPVELSTS